MKRAIRESDNTLTTGKNGIHFIRRVYEGTPEFGAALDRIRETFEYGATREQAWQVLKSEGCIRTGDITRTWELVDLSAFVKAA